MVGVALIVICAYVASREITKSSASKGPPLQLLKTASEKVACIVRFPTKDTSVIVAAD